MTSKEQTQTIEELRQVMKKINQAWLKGRPQELQAYFHPDIHFTGPKLETLASGRAVCIESYQDFINQAAVRNYSEYDFDIQVWGNTALIRYTFDIEYDLGGKAHADTGKDLFVFAYHQGRWLAVWRLLLAD
jgi:hypothetical protein